MSEKKSLYDIIKENVKDGELPDTFSLPKDEDGDPNKIKWADGALDGVGIFHMGQPEVTDELIKIIADAFSLLPDNEKAMAKMRDFFAKIPPVSGIDDIQRYIINNTQTLDAKQVYSLAIDCVFSSEVNMVKAYCKKMGLDKNKWNSIVNKTPLLPASNRQIGGDAPSVYSK